MRCACRVLVAPGFSRGGSATIPQPQRHPVRRRRPARRHGHDAERAGHGGADASAACASPTPIRCSRPSPPPTPRRWRPATSSATPATSRNTIYVGFPVPGARREPVAPFVENDAVLGELDEHFGGDYLNEETILRAAARRRLLHRGDRQARPDPDLRPHRAQRRQDHRRRRRDRPAGGIPLSRRDASA